MLICGGISNFVDQIFTILDTITHKKIGLSSIWDIYDMKRYLRRVTKRNDRVFAHTTSIPAELVRELGLSDAIVELKIKDDTIIIRKVA